MHSNSVLINTSTPLYIDIINCNLPSSQDCPTTRTLSFQPDSTFFYVLLCLRQNFGPLNNLRLLQYLTQIDNCGLGAHSWASDFSAIICDNAARCFGDHRLWSVLSSLGLTPWPIWVKSKNRFFNLYCKTRCLGVFFINIEQIHDHKKYLLHFTIEKYFHFCNWF